MAGKEAAKRNRQMVKKRGCTTPGIGDIKLQNVPEALQTFENIISAYAHNKIKRPKFTALVYGLNSLTNMLRLSLEAEILKRIESIEKFITGENDGNQSNQQ